jgi:hypothetical protein
MSLRIRPQYLPLQSAGLPMDESETLAAMAGELSWWVNVPLVHRVLANPTGGELVAARPPPDAPHEDYLAYWSPSLYLLMYSLGWARPGKGLKWWFDAGRPTDDSRLELLSRVWDERHGLDLLAAWLWTSGDDVLVRHFRQALGLPGADRLDQIEPGFEWWQDLEGRFGRTNGVDQAPWMPFDPFHGGSDPMHFQFHLLDPLAAGTRGVLLRSDERERRAVLVTSRLRGWYGELVRRGNSLPVLSGRSWYVEVICLPIGYLGTYRLSRRTGVWFAGQHRFHSRGN